MWRAYSSSDLVLELALRNTLPTLVSTDGYAPFFWGVNFWGKKFHWQAQFEMIGGRVWE